MVWEGKDNLLSNLGLMLFSYYSSNYNRLTQRHKLLQSGLIVSLCVFPWWLLMPSSAIYSKQTTVAACTETSNSLMLVHPKGSFLQTH